MSDDEETLMLEVHRAIGAPPDDVYRTMLHDALFESYWEYRDASNAPGSGP